MSNFPFKAEKSGKGAAQHIHPACGKRFDVWKGSYYPVCPKCGRRDGQVQL